LPQKCFLAYIFKHSAQNDLSHFKNVSIYDQKKGVYTMPAVHKVICSALTICFSCTSRVDTIDEWWERFLWNFSRSFEFSFCI